MELFFNSVWALVAVASVCFWLRLGLRTPEHRHLSVVGLAMLVVILFPVISVSDDLWSLQNPAETDTSQRRIHRDCCSHSPFPAAAVVPEPAVYQPNFGFVRIETPRHSMLPVMSNPALDPVENRPPPAA